MSQKCNTASVSLLSRRLDPWGHAVPAPSFSKVEASGYLEFGVTRSFALVLAPTLTHSSDGMRTFSGRNVIRETGPLAALWYRF